MNAIKQTSEPDGPSMLPYKAALLEVRRLRGKAGRSAYSRAKLLVQVFEDRDFRTDNGNCDDFKAAALLDDYVEDLCLTFLDLRGLLARNSWREGRLMKMQQQMLKENNKSIPSGKPRVVVGNLRQKLEQQLEEARRAKAVVDSQRVSERDQLQARVAELVAENAALKARVEELERLLSMSSQAA